EEQSSADEAQGPGGEGAPGHGDLRRPPAGRAAPAGARVVRAPGREPDHRAGGLEPRGGPWADQHRARPGRGRERWGTAGRARHFGASSAGPAEDVVGVVGDEGHPGGRGRGPRSRARRPWGRGGDAGSGRENARLHRRAAGVCGRRRRVPRVAGPRGAQRGAAHDAGAGRGPSAGQPPGQRGPPRQRAACAPRARTDTRTRGVRRRGRGAAGDARASGQHRGGHRECHPGGDVGGGRGEHM
ncbi:MAG: Predicted D-glucarate or D-galactorate regulator, GntR family, partial [uncultured Rubrobacteraceae bacterium]